MAAKKNESKLEAVSRAVNRRKTAMVKLKQSDKQLLLMNDLTGVVR